MLRPNDMAVLSFLLAIFLSTCYAGSYVPVVLWTNISNEKCKSNIPIIPGESIQKLLESEYMECLKSSHPDVIKIFITDELDEFDFRVPGGNGAGRAFHHLQKSLNAYPSLVMPAVESVSVAARVQSAFNSFKGSTVSLVDLGRIDHSSDERTRRSIAVLDETMNENMLKLKPTDSFVAVFTAMSVPKPVLFDDADMIYHGRQLLSITEPFKKENVILVNYSKCIFITYTNLTLTYESDIFQLENPNVTSGSCNVSDVAKIAIGYTAVNIKNGSKNGLELSFKFSSNKSTVSHITWWSISSAVVTHSLGTGGTKSNYALRIFDRYSYTAPNTWSWVCEQPQAMVYATEQKEIKQKLQFTNLQMQPFDITNASYSRAHDCSGFLTGPIWMGVAVTIVLGIIFALGIMGMAALSTMDRFDDPRGKPLAINVQENN